MGAGGPRGFTPPGGASSFGRVCEAMPADARSVLQAGKWKGSEFVVLQDKKLWVIREGDLKTNNLILREVTRRFSIDVGHLVGQVGL